MKHYFISRDLLGWQWKANPSFGWSRFTDNVNDLKSMQSYLTLTRSLDPVTIQFVANNLKSANIFEVKRDNGKMYAVLNAEKQIPLRDWDFIPNDEAVKYFHDCTTPEIIRKSDGIPGILEKIQYLKKNADEKTLINYKNLVAEKMSDNAVKNYFADYTPGIQSEVYFITGQLIE